MRFYVKTWGPSIILDQKLVIFRGGLSIFLLCFFLLDEMRYSLRSKMIARFQCKFALKPGNHLGRERINYNQWSVKIFIYAWCFEQITRYIIVKKVNWIDTKNRKLNFKNIIKQWWFWLNCDNLLGFTQKM